MVQRRRRRREPERKTRGVAVDSGVSMPSGNRRGRPPKYPWETMDVGDSFLMENTSLVTAKSNVASSNRRYSPNHYIYALDEDNEENVRVWRNK